MGRDAGRAASAVVRSRKEVKATGHWNKAYTKHTEGRASNGLTAAIMHPINNIKGNGLG